jgi:simple sugar transport system permease protein
MNIKRNILLVMVISGGLAGLAGVGEVAGVAHRLFNLDIQGYGYMGILVAWLTRLNILAIVGVAFLYGVLLQGGVALQMAGVRAAVVAMLQAAIVLFALASPAVTALVARAIARSRSRPLSEGTTPRPVPRDVVG